MDINDLCILENVDEESVVDVIKKRYEAGLFYVSVYKNLVLFILCFGWGIVYQWFLSITLKNLRIYQACYILLHSFIKTNNMKWAL